MVPNDVEDGVVAVAASGEVLLRVVDDPVGADRPDRVELPGGVHARHVRPVRLRELHRERSHGAPRAIDQDLLSGLDPSLVSDGLHPERPGRWDGSSLFERQAGGLPFEPRLRYGRVLGECAAVAPEVGNQALPEDLITRLEPCHVPADRLDDPGQVRAGNPVLRRPQTGPHDPQDVGHAAHHVPHICVHRSRTNPNEHLIVSDRRPVNVAQLQNVG